MTPYQTIVGRINNLSAEQQKLYLRAANRELTEVQRRRLAEIKTDLNALWFKRKTMRPQCVDPLDLLMQARWNPPSRPTLSR